MFRIKKIIGRQIIDSRGNPTLEVEVGTGDGSFGRAAVPSGASTGIHEAVELRDGGEAWMGKGVERAVSHVNVEIQEALVGMDVTDQRMIDETMIDLDGTENKGNLGEPSPETINKFSLLEHKILTTSLRFNWFSSIRHHFLRPINF